MHHIPIHPALVHFPIVLWAASLALDLAGYFGYHLPEVFPGQDPAHTAMALGLVLAIPTMIAGLIDLRHAPKHGTATRILNRHLILTLTAVTAYGLQWIARSRAPEAGIWLIVNALSFLVLIVGAHYGAILVYRHGVGVQRGPNSDDKPK